MRNWRYYLILLLLAAFVWFILRNLSEVENVFHVFSQGAWQWIFVAFLIQVVYYLAYTQMYRSALYTVEVNSRFIRTLTLLLSSIVVNVVTHAAGSAGSVLLVDDASRRGQSSARAAAGVLFAIITNFVTFALILVIALIYLFRTHELQTYEILGSGILLILIIGLGTLLVIGLVKPATMQVILAHLQNWLARIMDLLKRSSPLPPSWAETNARDLSEAKTIIQAHPGRVIVTFGVSLFAHMLDIACLYALFLAFYHPVGLWLVLAGYAIGMLFWIVSITPQGIGVVEGVMTLAYTSLGIPVTIATTIALAFRGLTFWIPLGIGFLLLRRTKAFGFSGPFLPKNWSANAVAILTAMMGFVNLVSILTPSIASHFQLLQKYSPLSVQNESRTVVALAGVTLLILAVGLWRRSYIAWLLTLIVLGIAIVGQLLLGFHYEEAILALILLVWLLTLRSQFRRTTESLDPQP
jgi:uncharacterized protein (TIRG00374 family)